MLNLFLSHFEIACYLILLNKQRHLAGNFRGVSGRLCWIFKFCLDSFSVSAGVLLLHIVGQFCFFALVEICLANNFFLEFCFYFVC